MDFPTALLHDLRQLSSGVGLDDDAVGEPLTATVAAVSAAVPSYRGMHLTVVEDGLAADLGYAPQYSDNDRLTADEAFR